MENQTMTNTAFVSMEKPTIYYTTANMEKSSSQDMTCIDTLYQVMSLPKGYTSVDGVKELFEDILQFGVLGEVKITEKKNYKVNSATKSFQALRIFVNKEISELIYGLIHSAKILKKDGVLAVVTFHSLEDKIVKYFFKSLSEQKSVSRYTPLTEQPDTILRLIEKKAIVPSNEEINENLPSRSAKLRYAIKKTDFYDFKTDVLEKFSNLIEIENFGNKL